MRRSFGLGSACLAALSCAGGDDGSGPTTSHQIAGTWSYNMPHLEDGHGVRCSIMGPILDLSQSGVTFDGQVSGGAMMCTFAGDTTGGAMVTAPVLNGRISGDSVQFHVQTTDWRSVGTFVTPDSMMGLVNAFSVFGGQQVYLVGNWYSKQGP